MLFPSETWLLSPTDDMAAYPATDEFLEVLSSMAAKATDDAKKR